MSFPSHASLLTEAFSRFIDNQGIALICVMCRSSAGLGCGEEERRGEYLLLLELRRSLPAMCPLVCDLGDFV